MPRKPTKEEADRNQGLEIYNKKDYLGKGIYCSHSYAILGAKDIVDKTGTARQLIHIRNPWMNEEWKGQFKNGSPLWSEFLMEKLKFDPKINGHGQFWMPLKDAMNYFSMMKVCKVVPGHKYNAIKLKFPEKNFVRAVVRFTVKTKGKYTISFDQKDVHFFQHPKFTYSPVKLTLCKLENAEFKLLSHTSSVSLRNTYIRKLIDEGEYYILIEQRCSEVNKTIELENKDPKQTEELKGWRNAVFSVYGPKICPIKIVECEDIHVIHDYLLYEGWKNYAK